MNRTATIRRETKETQIELRLDLDGTGKTDLKTGVGFFDHMLTHLGRHGMFDLAVAAQGDLHIDAHHTVEDVGICFGKALVQALGDKTGIRRYGNALVPMDETLSGSAIDLSGRPFLVWKADIANETLGTFHSSLAEEFWRAASSAGLFNLHVTHCITAATLISIIEAIFKATACALREAVVEHRSARASGIPSTKGVL